MGAVMRSHRGAPGPAGVVLLACLSSVASFACNSTQAVEDAGGCAEPCCNGNAARIDCGEHPNLSCTEPGDPCIANHYGCTDGLFVPPSPPPSGCGDASADGSLRADADAAREDAPAAVVDSGALFACGDAACAVGSQYCRQTSGGAPPGVELATCESAPDGQSICEQDAAGSGCSCSEDAGATYLSCQVP
jgi:hypothetical protein